MCVCVCVLNGNLSSRKLWKLIETAACWAWKTTVAAVCPSVCLSTAHTHSHTRRYTHTSAISNDDLCPAWKAGMHNCSSHKQTQIHLQLNKQGCGISVSHFLSHTPLKKKTMTGWMCCNSSDHQGNWRHAY